MARLSKADWQLIREALNHAVEERDSYRDSVAGSNDESDIASAKRCDDFIRRAEAFSQKHFGKATDVRIANDRLAALPSVSIFTLAEELKA